MNITDNEVSAIVKEVIAKLQLAEPEASLGIFDDMNEAIAAAKEAQKIVRAMPLDAREKVIANIRKKTIENAEILARMGVEETGMGNVGHKILKHKLTAEMTPGTEDIKFEEITDGIQDTKLAGGNSFTIKSLERTKKGLEARLKKLQASDRKDDVIYFEQLGVDRMFVDESDNYKNLFLYTKMRNVAGLSTTDAQKSSDMFSKCRYMDELTGGRGVVFATGTPVSNSMTELYTIQRYLQHDRLQEMGMGHFDCWASRFGETTTALELAPEGYTLIGR